MFPNLIEHGVLLVREALSSSQIRAWRERADEGYTLIEASAQSEGNETGRPHLPPGQQYLPNVSSITLGGVYKLTVMNAPA